MEKVDLKNGEELILRCKNSHFIEKKKYKTLEGPIVVNVNCETPGEINTPLTFREAMLAGDLYAIPSAGHMFSGVQTKYLPPTHLPDGTPNPARRILWEQRSQEREQALANMSKKQLAEYKEKIANLTGDPRLEHAKNIGLYPAYNLAVKAKEAKQKAKEANRDAKKLKKDAKKAIQYAKKLKKTSLNKSKKKNKSRGGRKKLRKKTKKRRPNRKKRKRKKKKTRKK
tara:strand:+ start:4837 stop:5517 length:681 start_codon:yes stop_codon:yes gene_type:complete